MSLYMQNLNENQSPAEYSTAGHGVSPCARTKGRLRAMANAAITIEMIQIHEGLKGKENGCTLTVRASQAPAAAPANGREQTSSALNLNASATCPCSNRCIAR